MNKTAHSLYRSAIMLTVIAVVVYLAYTVYSYYTTSIEEKFYHPQTTGSNPVAHLVIGLPWLEIRLIVIIHMGVTLAFGFKWIS